MKVVMPGRSESAWQKGRRTARAVVMRVVGWVNMVMEGQLSVGEELRYW